MIIRKYRVGWVQTFTNLRPSPATDMADSVCLHCERRPSAGLLGLCAVCHARPCIRVLYAVRRRDWTPEWEAHLRRMAERAKKKLPLFEEDSSAGGAADAG